VKGVKTIDDYLAVNKNWIEEIVELREILILCGMEESIKWGAPVYSVNGKNIVGIGAFKSYFGIWFFQGALLKDEKNVLYNAQDGKTRAMLQWRFNSMGEINKPLVKEYVLEAIENQKKGLEIKQVKKSPPQIPSQFKLALEKDHNLKISFNELSPFKQREYIEFIAEAKRDSTKLNRIDKIIPMIMNGIGLNDKYR